MDERRFVAFVPKAEAPRHTASAWHPPLTGSPSFDYAGFWRRFVASIIDGILLNIVNVTIEVMVYLLYERIPYDAETSPPWLVLIILIVSPLWLVVMVDWLYNAGLESSAWQATPGKRALGIKVTDLNGNRISFGRATVRFVAHLVSVVTLLIGYLIQPFTAKRQALHDLIARTLVIEA